MKRTWDDPRAGFTLIEILVVMGIIAVVAGLVLGASRYASVAAREARTRAELETVHQLLDDYFVLNGVYPARISDDLLALPDGQPRAVDGWPLDPWSNRYVYLINSPFSYALSSGGPDGTATADDDIESGR